MTIVNPMRKRWRLLIAVIGVSAGFSKPDFAQNKSDESHFDLICHVHGKVISDPRPDYTGTYPANVHQWRYRFINILDLKAMRYCDAVDCARMGVDVVVSADREKIVFADKPNDKEIYWRRRFYWQARLIDGRRVSLTSGPCRIAKFSGFPPVAVRPAG